MKIQEKIIYLERELTKTKNIFKKIYLKLKIKRYERKSLW